MDSRLLKGRMRPRVAKLAARLESQAEAGEILVSLETAALARDLTGGGDTRLLQLKGIELPVQAMALAKH